MRLPFAWSVFQFQHFHSRYFLHEHPAEDTYWKETSVATVISLPGAMTSRFDQCCYGLTSPYEGNQSTNNDILHNVPAIDAEFGNRYCTCRVRHRQIMGFIHVIPFEPLLPCVLPETLPGHGPANSGSTPNGMGTIGGFRRQGPGGRTWERPEADLPESHAD